MKQYIFFLALIVLVSTFAEAGKKTEILDKVKKVFSKGIAGVADLNNMSELGCPFIEKWCEDHCESKKQVGKCENFDCSCVKLGGK
uniref:Neurotoxin beta-KTx 17 n=2 Tax=Lychas mucronatus TaxID=172552 RepID=KBX27_LYCMC|nr:RecName: Full=Neurotoxin beta-KTx 17; AltName: Full=Neurotoxin KTx6; Flags: Precursor [Lychas mucronatus]ABY26660.1 neurotoxin KTx5 [Lychas mucronatus]